MKSSEVDNLFRDAVLRDLYLGLVYERSRTGSLTFGIKDFHEILGNGTSLNKIEAYVKNVSDKVETLQASTKELKALEKEDRNLDAYFNYYMVVFEFVEAALTLKEFDDVDGIEPAVLAKLDGYVGTIKDAGAIYYNIRSRNFGAVVLNTTVLLNETIFNVEVEAADAGSPTEDKSDSDFKRNLFKWAISGSLNEMKWVKVPWFLAWGRG